MYLAVLYQSNFLSSLPVRLSLLLQRCYAFFFSVGCLVTRYLSFLRIQLLSDFPITCAPLTHAGFSIPARGLQNACDHVTVSRMKCKSFEWWAPFGDRLYEGGDS